MKDKTYTIDEARLFFRETPNRYDAYICGNEKFNKLTPIFHGKVNTTYALFCECDCGKVVFRKLAALKSGRASDCGCGKRGKRDLADFNKFLIKFKDTLYKYNITVTQDQWKSDSIPYYCPVHEEHMTIKKFNIARGQPCGMCGKADAASKRLKTTTQFIADAIKVHGDDYDYSETVYNGVKDSIKIKCKVSGKFFYPTADDHLQGCKCSCCFDTGGYRKIYKR